MRPALAICVLLTLGAPFGRAVDLSRGEDRLTLPAPRLGLERWLNSPPLEMDRLHGRVVLVRWWTDGCPYCAATAPALKHLDAKYGARGLRVIGIFHPKPAGDWSVERMRAATQQKGFTFPVALDGGWTALDRWWPDLEKRGWTSVSFVVDKKGIIRYVHPGGEFHEATVADHARCDRDYKDVEQTIERLLRE
jgi:thiol-disulfide isomerase/thioredoxin